MTEWIMVADAFETSNRHLYTDAALLQMAELLPGTFVRREINSESIADVIGVVIEAKYEGLQLSVKVEPVESSREWFDKHQADTGLLVTGCVGLKWRKDESGTLIIDQISEPYAAYSGTGSVVHSHR